MQFYFQVNARCESEWFQHLIIRLERLSIGLWVYLNPTFVLCSAGHFGCVYRGTLELEGKGEVQSVAVKTLHNSEWDTLLLLSSGL